MTSDYYAAARELEPQLVSFMQDIIRIPSLSSEEGAVIERIREEMLAIGYDQVTVDPMGNLIGRIGSGPRVIAFDGHVDVTDVDAGDRIDTSTAITTLDDDVGFVALVDRMQEDPALKVVNAARISYSKQKSGFGGMVSFIGANTWLPCGSSFLMKSPPSQNW